MFWFELWREYRLSIAELYSLFPEMEIVYSDEKILLADRIDENDILNNKSNLWWIIKIFNISPSPFNNQDNEKIYDEIVLNFWNEKKNNYAINFFWKTKINQKDYLLKAKKHFQKAGFSSRFVNQDFWNIKSYLVWKEKLLVNSTDFNLIFIKNSIYFWNTIFVQDIDSYSKRDFWKTRDMLVWMLPPKLAQIMINLSKDRRLEKKILDKNFVVYDPFCWLWTILLESIISWNKEVYWSDLSNEMVWASNKNIEYIKSEFKNNLSKYDIVKFDAKDIEKSQILKNNKIDVIVSEWYLWEIFTKTTVSFDNVKIQRQNLLQIYESFFSWLKESWFEWVIVISFPFWEIKWKYNYFEEIYELLKKYCVIQDLLPKEIGLISRSWSLMYKRPEQIVWREIFKLKIKQ